MRQVDRFLCPKFTQYPGGIISSPEKLEGFAAVEELQDLPAFG